jgi:hypothetical protein
MPANENRGEVRLDEDETNIPGADVTEFGAEQPRWR